jgi:hypothetical protein
MGEVDHLRVFMEPVARLLLGDPNPQLSTAKILRWGNRGSMAVDVEKGVWYNNEAGDGGGVLAFIEQHEMIDHAAARDWLHERFPESKPNGHAPGPQITNAYPYEDVDTTLLFEVCRKFPKTFLQRRPDGHGGWVWSTKGVKRVPYRLPEVLAAIAAGRKIWIVEGEKDADRLWVAGLAATTNPGGAGKWKAELSPYFKDADVVVVGDNDPQSKTAQGVLQWHADGRPQLPGQDHAQAVAASVRPFAARVRVLDLGKAWPACPPKGDVSDYLASHGAADLEALAEALREVEAGDDDFEAVVLPAGEISDIPPRTWAYGRYMLFGSAAVLGAADGVGKGFLTTAIILSMIFGRALLGERVWRSGSVAIITYEDDMVEWQRKIAAGCLYYGLDYATAMRGVHFLRHRTDARVVLARHEDGRILFPDSYAIIRELRACGAVMLVVDPFNSAHAMDDGNANVAIAAVAGEVTRIAQAANVAALVLHHLRKGASGAVDDLMGAVALRANFRSTRILARMTAEEGEALGIEEDQCYRYFRVAGTKENYAPPPDKAHWMKLVSQLLGNGNDAYPDGDDLAVATVWTQPSPFAGLDWNALKRVFEGLRDGPGEGWFYANHHKARHQAIPFIMETGGLSKAQATGALRIWMDNGVVHGETYTTPKNQEVTRLAVVDDKVALILAQHRPVPPVEPL